MFLLSKGKGVSLAKYIQSLQKSRSVSGTPRSVGDPCLTSGYISDESDDSSFSFVSMDDSLLFNDDMESDGEVSESSHVACSFIKISQMSSS